MKIDVPVVRRTAWTYLVPQLILLLLLTLFFWKAFPTSLSIAGAYAAVVYLLYSFGSKSVLLKYHREGMHFAKLKAFREAISRFQSSYEFLQKHPWLDKYRFITMLDSSAMSYREMALCNIAYSHAQLDERVLALKYYERALEQFPQSQLARRGVDYIVRIEK